MPDQVIQVTPAQLRAAADRLDQASRRIQQAVSAVEAETVRLSPQVFAGLRAAHFQTSFTHQRETLQTMSGMLSSFGRQLTDAAAVFQTADQAPGADLVAMAADLRERLRMRHFYAGDQLTVLEADAEFITVQDADGQVHWLTYDEYNALIADKELRGPLLDRVIPNLEELREQTLKDIQQYKDEQRGARGLLNSIAGVKDDYADLEQSARDRLARIDDLLGRLCEEQSNLPYEIQQLTAERDSRWHAGTVTVGGGSQNVYFSVPMNQQPNAANYEGYCLAFATDWRADMGGHRFGSAKDLIYTNDPYVSSLRYQVDPGGAITEQVRPGHLLVYDSGQWDANVPHGHVAVVTEVHGDYVIVKESSWDKQVDTWREVPLDQLKDLTLIGDPWGTNQ